MLRTKMLVICAALALIAVLTASMPIAINTGGQSLPVAQQTLGTRDGALSGILGVSAPVTSAAMNNGRGFLPRQSNNGNSGAFLTKVYNSGIASTAPPSAKFLGTAMAIANGPFSLS